MAAIHKFSEQVIDYAERLSEMADAAEGKHQNRGGTMRRWVLLPASGAALYALVKSDFFSRRAKGVVDEAKARASDLPDDLMGRVRQTTARGSTSGQNGSASTRRTNSARRTSSARKSSARKSSARRTKSGSR
jgi:hypothetical protein